MLKQIEMRLIIDPPAAGAWNMAVDEALLESAAERGVATLRFYEWSEPTLSLGYFQTLADRNQHSASLACPVVRRASGGGAIIHDRELTYSLAVPGLGPAASRELYDAAHETLIQALALFGIQAQFCRDQANCQAGAPAPNREPFLCFQRRTCTDVVLGEAKIAGSAQRRRRGAVLQHGSFLLGRSSRAPELPGICDLADVAIEPGAFASAWLPHLESRLQYRITNGVLTAEEVTHSASLAQGRFASADYLERR